MVSDETEGIVCVSKKTLISKQPITTTRKPSPQTISIARASGNSTVSTQLRNKAEAGNVPLELSQQQIHTPSGNETNERGSFVGETGNSKIQK